LQAALNYDHSRELATGLPFYRIQEHTMFNRTLGRSGTAVSALGLGCWAIGGPWKMGESPAGWGQVDDDESIRAIHCALDLGITFFDTAANYGCGHSEQILGLALAGRRSQVVIATKFGYLVDEEHKVVRPSDDVVGSIRQDCDASLRRLKTDYIDLYQFHVGAYDPKRAAPVRDALESLVADGKIRCYGWSTDNPEGARVFAEGKHCVAIQHDLHILRDAPEMLAICDELDLASVNRSPLARGLLTGKYSSKAEFPGNDNRSKQGFRTDWLPMVERIGKLRHVLTRDGRTLGQGALGWIWAHSPRTIPIPGFKTVAQVKENAQAIEFGPLTGEQMTEIEQLLGNR
jgi:aryl-alcohol dehydrogenase-like predicted oxidoreductase